MTATPSLLDRIFDAQTRNSTLAGAELRDAAQDLAALTTRSRRALLAVDEAGQRLIGAALLMDERVRTVDVSRRLDGLDVTLVAGYVADTTGIALKAALARSLGVRTVDAAVLGGPVPPVEGCDHVSLVAPQRHLRAL